jgi:hypothetical protein
MSTTIGVEVEGLDACDPACAPVSPHALMASIIEMQSQAMTTVCNLMDLAI